MNNHAFLQLQTAELQRLLDGAGNDPILGPQLRERLEETKRQLAEERRVEDSLIPMELPDLPRAAVFVKGMPVVDSNGIRPALAGEALIQYERMFIEQAIHDERSSAQQKGKKRRPRGAVPPSLLFTGTPRGSFGLEFVPQPTDDSALLTIHAQSLQTVSDTLVKVAAAVDTSELDKAVSEIPSRVLHPLVRFFEVMAEHGAEIRLASCDRKSRTITAIEIAAATERLRNDVQIVTAFVTGVFRGVTLDSGYFDFHIDSGEDINGQVADAMTDDDIERISDLKNQRCEAEIQETSVGKVSGETAKRFVLIDARPLD